MRDAEHLGVSDDLEPESAVELYVFSAVGLQVPEGPGIVELRTELLHQPPADAVTLDVGRHPYGAKVRMRHRGIVFGPGRQPRDEPAGRAPAERDDHRRARAKRFRRGGAAMRPVNPVDD